MSEAKPQEIRPKYSRSELEAHHGTPVAFADACWRAHSDGLITLDEAVAAIRKYEREWQEAA